jgi:hypothetical protein
MHYDPTRSPHVYIGVRVEDDITVGASEVHSVATTFTTTVNGIYRDVNLVPKVYARAGFNTSVSCVRVSTNSTYLGLIRDGLIEVYNHANGSFLFTMPSAFVGHTAFDWVSDDEMVALDGVSTADNRLVVRSVLNQSVESWSLSLNRSDAIIQILHVPTHNAVVFATNSSRLCYTASLAVSNSPLTVIDFAPNTDATSMASLSVRVGDASVYGLTERSIGVVSLAPVSLLYSANLTVTDAVTLHAPSPETNIMTIVNDGACSYNSISLFNAVTYTVTGVATGWPVCDALFFIPTLI